jgi:RimJ/RimL family protein N-acetyltransferase
MRGMPTLLSPMTLAEYHAWLAESVPDYARDKIAAGEWREDEALARSRAEVDGLLPHGQATAGHHLWAIRERVNGPSIGTLWVAEQQHGTRRVAYVFDFRIAAAHRRQGHARRAFLALEDAVRPLDVDGISLHVFGRNAAARALYESLGYAATHITMSKPLR